MKRLTFDVEYNNNSANTDRIYTLNLCDNAGNKTVLELNENQNRLIASRHSRSFYIRCKKEKILQEIDDAVSGKALEDIAKRYYLCDACSFEGINLYGVKRILKVVVDCLYRYPKLRSKLCFIGTHHQLEKLLTKMKQGDKEVLNAFNLQYICSEQNAIKLGCLIYGIMTRLIKDHERYVATALCAFGLFDAMLLDKNDYDGYAYLEFVKALRMNETSGFHPKGCRSPESVVYHELGHLLDNMCGLKESADFKAYYGTLTERDIEHGLSRYACKSPGEFIAEAFAKCMCNPQPRPIALKTGELLDRAYGK